MVGLARNKLMTTMLDLPSPKWLLLITQSSWSQYAHLHSNGQQISSVCSKKRMKWVEDNETWKRLFAGRKNQEIRKVKARFFTLKEAQKLIIFVTIGLTTILREIIKIDSDIKNNRGCPLKSCCDTNPTQSTPDQSGISLKQVWPQTNKSKLSWRFKRHHIQVWIRSETLAKPWVKT